MSPTHDEIAQMAYSLYESHGRQEGHQFEDWLRAERELVRHSRKLRSIDQNPRRTELASIKRKDNL